MLVQAQQVEDLQTLVVDLPPAAKKHDVGTAIGVARRLYNKARILTKPTAPTRPHTNIRSAFVDGLIQTTEAMLTSLLPSDDARVHSVKKLGSKM